MTFDKIVAKYSAHNEEETYALNYAKENNNTPYFNDVAQVMDGKTLIKEGMIVIRKHPRFCYISKHSHNYLEINYILSGEITEILDDNKITLKQGELVFISKNSKHEFLPANENDILLNFIILPEFFDSIIPFIDKNGNIKKFLLNLLSNKEENNSIIFHLSNCETVQNLIKNILIIYDEKDEKLGDVMKNYFLLLILELLKHTNQAEETKTANYDSIILFKTYNYIENNYVSGSLSELSTILNDDYNYLSKRIKKLTKLSFQQLLEKERINVAKTLIESTDININDIAYHIGYSNLTFFYSLFRKNVGCTPMQYREKMTKDKQSNNL